MPSWIVPALQIVVGLGLLNVWLLRAKSPTPYRGGSARTLKEEFGAYGLPEWFYYLIGTLKIGAGVMLILGVAVSSLVAPAAGVVVVLMLGALAMHVKVKDALIKSLPAFMMLAMSSGILLLS